MKLIERTWVIDGHLSMYFLAVGLFRECIMGREHRKRVRNLSRRLSKTAMEKRLYFSVMDGHRTLRY
jgi:hypothetical protein